MITSDDYGYSDTRDDGILECFKSGAITGAAAIVNGVSIESGVAKAKLCGMPLSKSFGVLWQIFVALNKVTTWWYFLSDISCIYR